MDHYLIPLNDAFCELADTANAVPMQAYMRDKFAFYGIKSPERKQVLKIFIKQHGLPEKDKLKAIIKEMWLQPEREWQYCAQELLLRCKKLWTEDLLSLFEWMVLEKSWWDTVDFISSNLIGKYFEAFPSAIEAVTSDWANSENVWLIRTAIIFQRSYKQHTDEDLLFGYILQHCEHPDFFVRKGIGWALRDYAKVNPEAVLEFVENHPLAPLSKREALKHLT